MSGLPPLPRIDGDFDLMLDVYTHKSLNMGSHMNNDYGDTERLGELGAKVLDLTVTYHFFSQRPFLNPEEIQARKVELTLDSNLDTWLKAYGLKEKLRVAPSNVHLLNDPEEIRKFFHTYVGALYIRNGLPVIQAWISGLIDPTVDVQLPAAPPQPPFADGHYGQPMGYSSPQSSQTYSNYSASPSPMGHYSPAPPPGPPPPLPSSPPSMTASGAMSLVTLALVNQTAAQKGLQVSYPAEQVGPSHQPTWTVRCCINGQEKGRGVGKSQKAAKEEAARQAWAAMGWGPT